jgi:hypothetical protein
MFKDSSGAFKKLEIIGVDKNGSKAFEPRKYNGSMRTFS